MKTPDLKGVGCFCAYIASCRGISVPFILSAQNSRFPACLVGGDFKGFPTIVLILEHNIKVFVVVFLFFGGKHDADVFSTFTTCLQSERGG